MSEEEKEAIKYFYNTYTFLGDETALHLKTLLNLLQKLQEEIKEKNQNLKRVCKECNEEEAINRNLRKKINNASVHLEYYLIGNLRYEDSQNEFKKILKMLQEEV